MSLDSCRPLSPLSLSLSLLYCLDLCLSRGAVSGHPNPTRIGEWDEGSTGGLSRREGSLHLFMSWRLSARVHAIGWRRAHGALSTAEASSAQAWTSAVLASPSRVVTPKHAPSNGRVERGRHHLRERTVERSR
jgi:hypothetical protein